MLFMMDTEVPTLFQTLQAPGKVAGCLLLGLSRREFVRRPGLFGRMGTLQGEMGTDEKVLPHFG
jgi:hypothetical protein